MNDHSLAKLTDLFVGYNVPLTRRRLMLATSGVAATALLAACAGDDDGDPGPVDEPDDDTEDDADVDVDPDEEDSDDEPDDEPTADDDDRMGGSLSLADQVLPPTLDIHVTTNDFLDIIGQQVYQPLVYLDPETKETVAGLAETWELGDDGTTWTFQLRTDVHFHDGNPFTADAITASWDRLLDPATQAPRAGLLGGDNLLGYEAVDDHTFEVTHQVPMANFAANIARTFAMVISPAAIEEYGEGLAEHMVGTGPFRLKEYEQADLVTLERWDDFNWAPSFFIHDGPAYLDEFTFYHIPEEGTRIAAFERGDLSIVRLPWSQFRRFDQEIPGVAVTTISNPGVPGGMFLNSQLAPLDDINVRKALGHVVDRETIVGAPIFGGAVWIEHGPLTSDVWGYDETSIDSWPEYDIEQAEQLLADAGWEAGDDGVLERDGERMELSLPTTVLSVPVAQVIQSQFEQIGVAVEITQMDATAVAAQWEAGNDHIIIGANTANDPDVLSDVFGPGQRSRAEDPEAFRLLEAGQQAVDLDERAEVYSELQHYLADQVYTLHIYNSARNYGALDTIQEIKFNDRAGIYLYDMWVDD